MRKINAFIMATSLDAVFLEHEPSRQSRDL